ncbi:LysR family transcriptional regulator [Peribacillus loiseleuriae]|uniref:LysR family transcriptional regulator n=1 Tax=Peribacillus loiseleuriae TaxID=1679170 RepID=UPI003D02B646
MDIRSLRYFISVAEHLNFTEAAKQLYVAQSAVSQQIAILETKIGVKLFDRNKHSVQLTDAGSVLLKDARDILKKLDESIENARQAEEGLIGTINLGLLSAEVGCFFPVLVREFRRKYPKVKINFNYDDIGKIREKLKTDELDMAFTLSIGLQNIGGLEHKKLWTEPHCIVMHEDHPLANKTSIDIGELAHESFVMLDRQEYPPAFDLMLAACANHGFSPNIINLASRIEAVLMMVDSGIGITILPKFLQLYYSPTLRFINIEGDDFKVDVVASWKKMNRRPSLSLFIEVLESILAQKNDYFSLMSSKHQTKI